MKKMRSTGKRVALAVPHVDHEFEGPDGELVQISVREAADQYMQTSHVVSRQVRVLDIACI